MNATAANPPRPQSAGEAAGGAPSNPGIVPLTYLSGGGAAVVAVVGLALIAWILAYSFGLLQWISTR